MERARKAHRRARGGALLIVFLMGAAGPAFAGAPGSCGCTPTPAPSPGAGRTYSYGAASATSAASVSASLRGTGVGGAQAVANSAGGGFGVFSEQGGVTTNIESVQVESAPASRVCAAFRALSRTVTIRASCLDDRDVPHPASQVAPERQVPDGFDGEVFRCIAGTRLQYTILQSESAADGQSVSCGKGDALYHDHTGRLACRAQKPARDCNERSLLRRYGAGVKTLTSIGGQECVSWREEAAGPTTDAGLHVELSPAQP